MGQHTDRSIGKVLPLRQHARNPAVGSPLERLPSLAPRSAEPSGDSLAGVRTWLAALATLEARHAEALESDAVRLRVADGGLSETLSLLRRLRDLAGRTRSDRSGRIEAERWLAHAADELARIAENTEVSGTSVLSGPDALFDASPRSLGLDGLEPGDPRAVPRIDAALERVVALRTQLSHLEDEVDERRAELDVALENLGAAHASPGDVAGAVEVASELRAHVVADAAQAVRSQSVAPAVVLRLVR